MAAHSPAPPAPGERRVGGSGFFPGRGSDPAGRVLMAASLALAVFGGVLLSAIMLTAVVSIAGRNLATLFGLRFLGPVPGDFELIEQGVAIAIVSFLPYTQMVRGNVAVDFFVARAGGRTRAAFATLGNALFTVLAAVLAWQFWRGFLDRLGPYGEQTLVLAIPTRWGYLAATICFAILAIVCLYTVLRSLGEALGDGEPPR